MSKFGVIKEGQTPSCISGKPSEKVENNEAICENEKIASSKHLENSLDDLNKLQNKKDK